ncbi:MAG TPA: T9SS type A sorting domain-containing protein [Candidatus Acetothermia bacterium]|nr:T9SS type A sorting domain-containing protein [Candidatus Acetothermia bacterium]
MVRSNLIISLAALAAVYAFIGSSQVLFEDHFEYPSTDAAIDIGWRFQGIAQVVGEDLLTGETLPVVPFPSSTRAAYFGVIDILSGTGNYMVDGQAVGMLITPLIPIGEYNYVAIRFKYFREVEYGPPGYDRTWVEVSFDRGNTWQQVPGAVWDSSVPSAGEWEEYSSKPIQVPAEASGLLVRFCFDSVDSYANDYLGWLIDDLVVEASVSPLTIETEFLPPATVGEYYEVQLEARGGTGVYRWRVLGREGLPPRLTLDGGTGVISGIPEQAGLFSVTVQVTDSRGNHAERDFVLSVRSVPPEALWFDDFSDARVWQCEGLWHITQEVVGVDMPEAPAAYFGQDDLTTPNYAVNGQAMGYLTLAAPIRIPAQGEGKALTISFSSWREVESYQGPYDRTFLEISLDGGQTWDCVWEKDSSDPSGPGWIVEVVDTEVDLSGGCELLLRFGFDSVDGYSNDYVGWLVDNVTVMVSAPPLAIDLPCPLPPGTVGEAYRLVLRARGGSGDYSWRTEGLPPGLELVDERGEWAIAGIPRQAGLFTVTLEVEDLETGARVVTECELEVKEVTLIYREDFETADGYQITGLWHPTSVLAGWNLSGYGTVLYYGKDDDTSPNYDTMSANSGMATFGPVELPVGTEAFLIMFDYLRQVEEFAEPFDITAVQVRLGGGNWVTVWVRDSRDPSDEQWHHEELGPFLTGGEEAVWIRFVFDTVDLWYNDFLGWAIDNLEVHKAPAEGAVPLHVAGLSPLVPASRVAPLTVLAVPNPVRDVHTTVFTVRGLEVEAIRVEVYDLTGRLVWRAEAPGSELVWHTEGLDNLPLANGIYLYRTYVRVGGGWISLPVQKIVILR